MARMRRVLRPLAAIWLFSQIGAVTLAPVALWIAAADPHGVECTCGHGLGAMCPMHHKPSGDSAQCAMRSATASEAAVLASLVGIVGLVAEPTRSIEPATPSAFRHAVDVQGAGLRPVPPDPPPPRA